MKKFIIIASSIGTLLLGFGIVIIMAVAVGNYIGKEIESKQYETLQLDKSVINNQLYASRYRNLLLKHIEKDGYIPLERLVFYLQRTNNVLDVTTLSDEKWEEAYMNNIDSEYHQMIPIKTLCKKVKSSSLPEYTITTGTNSNGVLIEKLDLCNIDGVDITLSDDYNETMVELPYVSPFSNDVSYTLTSMVFENRNVEFDISQSLQNRVNYHSGWDFAVPIGTEFRSICDGKITSIVMTQANDLPFDKQVGIKNETGNYIYVECDNGYISQYLHIKYNSIVNGLKVGDEIKKGDVLGLTSTTGLSTGPHLHLGLKTQEGVQLDAFNYIQFVELTE